MSLLVLAGSLTFFSKCVDVNGKVFGKISGGPNGGGPNGGGPDGEYPYVCSNGTATVGTTSVENTEQCDSCDPGFAKAGDSCVVELKSLDAFVANNGGVNHVLYKQRQRRVPCEYTPEWSE